MIPALRIQKRREYHPKPRQRMSQFCIIKLYYRSRSVYTKFQMILITVLYFIQGTKSRVALVTLGGGVVKMCKAQTR